jgi:hypothetical protein
MGKQAETRDELRKESITKIHGQPTDQDITTLKKELIAIAANIPTTLGGENYGRAGLIVDATKYLTMAGVAFVIPPNPGIYPAGLAANAVAGTWARAVEHKEEVAQYKILKGVEQALKDIILEAVENDCLVEIEDDTLGVLNQTPRQMIDHLKARGGALDFADTKTLLAERDTEWDLSKNPQVYFNRVEKAVKALTRASITSDMNEHSDMALYNFKAWGEFNAAVREWENKPAADKTWINIKTFIATEYACENKQTRSTRNNSKPISLKNRPRQRRNSSQHWRRTIHVRWRHSSRAQQMQWRRWCNSSNPMPPLRRTPSTFRTKKRKRNAMRNERNITRHLSALTAVKNIQRRRRTSAGNLRRINLPAQSIGNRQRAPEGARGIQ